MQVIPRRWYTHYHGFLRILRSRTLRLQNLTVFHGDNRYRVPNNTTSITLTLPLRERLEITDVQPDIAVFTVDVDSTTQCYKIGDSIYQLILIRWVQPSSVHGIFKEAF